MELFKNKVDKGSFDDLVNLINESKSNEELIAKVREWKPNIEKYDVDYWADNIFSESIKKIDINKLPEVLDVFYKTTDKFTFMLFCMILESTIDELPYLTNLENERLFVAKWEFLKESICTIIKNSNSGLVDCILLILLNNDPTGKYLTDEEKNNVIIGLNRNLDGIYKYLTSSNSIDLKAYKSLEIMLDAATYFNDNQTKELIEKIKQINIDDDSIIFLIKYQLVNGLEVDEKNINRILDNKSLKHKLFHIYDSLDKLSMLKDKINQEDIATSKMIEWLIYPTELGKLPTDIQLVDTMELDDLVYYLFKFKTDVDKLKDNDYMLGVVGGYKKNKLTTEFSGVVFSNFETINDGYKEQAMKLINMIQDYWKNKAK